jgi:hypothetical protein
MKTSLFRFFVELTLWSIANLLCMGLATSAVYVVGSTVLNWNPATMSFFLPATALLTSTWGAWSSMVWARNRAVRVGMYVSAGIPGIALIATGGLGLWVGFGAWFVWAGFILGGFAMIGATSALCRQFNPRTHSVPALSSLYGLLVHPIATLAASGGVAAVWYTFVSNPSGGWRGLVSLSTLMATLLGVALITTVIPAATSTLCRKLALESGERFNGF